ncbi:adenine deaminase C-terminal domain-containing protein [Rhizobium sp. CSW-27]|uniref:adenine deaminase n=1 Tax=Rhizobium sp. CSW-27 TaxID=2839985 RepID=UPI001C028D18|nr:adenine deaminase C-terminal domain-containing protein [Rhizobium sp. CSW-27]MBT9369049.1 amidohydrolase family protein [Rhizobium sp. CSW-27]
MTRPFELFDLNLPELRLRAVQAARGEVPFDLLLRGGTVVDVVTGELRPADVGIVGPLIASVHAPGSRLDSASTINAAGAFIAPGLVDTHMHIESSMVTPAAYAQAVVPRGVTTVVWDPHEFGNVLGLAGVNWAADAVIDLPLRVILLAPSSVPSAPGLERAGAEFGPDVLADLLARPDIAGIAEMMNMRGIIEGDPRMTDIIQAGLETGKLVCGHARSLTGRDLQAFVTAGVSSDHELVSGDDLMEKLRAGLAIELRGSHDHLLPDFVAALERLGHLPQTVTLCTDDVFPDDLQAGGGLDDVVRRLVGYGMRPEWALQAATLNGARRLGRPDLGLVAPGRRADLVLFEDLSRFEARRVLVSGREVAAGGALLSPPAATETVTLTGTMKLSPLSPEDFRIAATGETARVATIDQPRFTCWGEAVTAVRDGCVVPPEGATLIAVAHRHGLADPKPRVGFLTGWGTWRGAFATTVSHDSHNLTVFGQDPVDMAAAANAVIAAGGGLAVASGGTVQAVLPLPLAGLVAEAGVQETAAGFAAIRAAIDRIVDWQPPYLVFKACFGATLACNAGPHQTDLGIADVTSGRLLETPVLATW